jgi:hypothetical protein
MFVVKGGTKKRADCLANECTAKSVWVNCPVCHNKTKTKIYQDTLALRFPMYCPKCKKEMRAISKRSKKVVQNKNAAQKSSNPTLLADIVVCAHCGAKMSAFLHQRPAVLPAWISCPLPAAFSGSPLRGHRRVSHADGHAVFKVQQAKRKQKSRHRTDQPCLRFFWKVMLVGYVTAERICKNMLYSIVGIDYHKNRAVST